MGRGQPANPRGAADGRLARVAWTEPELPVVGGKQTHVFLELGDHLGSTSVVLDHATGELVERGTYQAYGGAESDYRPERWKGFREDYRFTGKEEDVEVGLQYFGKRYYAPLLNRWVSADPLTVHTFQADANVYAYVKSGPLRSTDPLGLSDERDYTDPVAAARMRAVFAQYQNIVVKVRGREISVRTPFRMEGSGGGGHPDVGSSSAENRAAHGKASPEDMRKSVQAIVRRARATDAESVGAAISANHIGADCSGASYWAIKAGNKGRLAHDQGPGGGLNVHGLRRANAGKPVQGWKLVGLSEARTGDLLVLGTYANGRETVGHKIAIISHSVSKEDGFRVIADVRFGEKGDVIHRFEVGSSWYMGQVTGAATRTLYWNETQGQWLDPDRSGGPLEKTSERPYREYDIVGVYRNDAYKKGEK